ncbi:TetR/AcrR family transcriptional regulator [Lysinibacillus sp. BW-2-10]|uniref:TetR/AcrR family transcriptional regulator n=1 Tax=Lysinibacillus sp. BW-2-10 TaxID=2590030 RepID=UPI0011800ACF|nr:TetR/AcrR family transcriptional regulator [Lysinibacillus sp. BW-2-10]TSI08273.1 TetR family transcriptional regulator [Lysinibacillus sp. BW-2-10]
MKHSDETKKILATSLKALMKGKSLEKISIRELTENAGVNRQTFYYHFEDIYDLLKWTFQQETIQLLDVHESTHVWQEGLLQLFRYLDENREICLCALRSLGRDHMKRFFYADIHNIFGRVVSEFGEKYEAPKEYMSFLTHFYTLSLGSLVESWLLDEMEQTPEEIIEMIDLFIQDQLRGGQQRIKGE